MLKQPTRVFQITGKQVLNNKVTRFILHDNLNYLNGISNHINCANIYPYINYQAGNHLGISIGEIERADYSSPPSQEVFNDRSMVNKVVKTPPNYNGFTITDLYFGGGRIEEE